MTLIEKIVMRLKLRRGVAHYHWDGKHITYRHKVTFVRPPNSIKHHGK